MSAINTIQLANGDEYDINDERISAVPIPITEGGTGATTAAMALTNLGILYGTADPSTAVATPVTGMIYLKKRS